MKQIYILIVVILFSSFYICEAKQNDKNNSKFLYNRNADRHGFIVFMPEGGWSWFQDPRAIVHNDHMFIGSVKGNGSGPAQVGVFDLINNKHLGNFVVHDNFNRDDHSAPVFFPRPDGSVLAVYARHNKEKVHYFRISKPKDYTKWSDEMIFSHKNLLQKDMVTYVNLFELRNEGILYNFFRGINFNPSVTISKDYGLTWKVATQFLKSELEGTHRPYVKFAGNGVDTIHISFTDAHPRQYGNSIYYAAFREGTFYRADGSLSKSLSDDGPLRSSEADLVYKGNGNIGGEFGKSVEGSAWVSSIAYDINSHPHIGYSVYLSNTDHRYRMASWDGANWIDREVAFAGKALSNKESSYTGLITLDPVDPRIVVVSTDVNPKTGEDDGGTHEIYRAKIGLRDSRNTIEWKAVTTNSKVRNIRPYIIRTDDKRYIIWNRGVFRTYRNYQMDTVGIVENN